MGLVRGSSGVSNIKVSSTLSFNGGCILFSTFKGGCILLATSKISAFVLVEMSVGFKYFSLAQPSGL
jgi:hypothetical protein